MKTKKSLYVFMKSQPPLVVEGIVIKITNQMSSFVSEQACHVLWDGSKTEAEPDRRLFVGIFSFLRSNGVYPELH